MKVTLTVRQNQVLVTPWLEFLEKVCTVTLIQKKFGYDPRDPRKVIVTPIALYAKLNTDQGCDGIFYTGQLQSVVAALQKDQHEVVIQDLRDPVSGKAPELPEGLEYRAHQREVIEAVLNNHNGIIQAPPAFGKSFCIAHLCRIFSDGGRIVVVTQRSTVLTQLFRNISAAVPEKLVTLCNGAKHFKPDSDIVVCSSRSMHNVPDDWPRILLFDEVHGAASALISRILSKFTDTRMYGFSATPTGRGDRGDKLVSAMFGPILMKIGYHEALASGNVTRTQVRMVQVNGPQMAFSNFTALNRHGYWRNGIRNHRIAEVVAALQAEGITKILVLVNTTEHAYYLRTALPSFAVVHAGLDAAKHAEFLKRGLLTPADGLTVDTEQILRDFQDSKVHGIVSTPKLREGVDLVALQAVIRADGVTGSIPSIQIGGRPSRIFEGKELAVVVDFVDNYGEDFLKRSRSRVKNYKDVGWTVVDWNL